MSVYKKLQEARVILHKTQLNKSGKNKFAGFSYFELADFIPQITEIFNKLGLCGIVSFTAETAYLTVHETEGDGFVTFTSPLVMAENAKGQAIQSLGSTHTYFRRYLWLMCMEIIENDVIDAVDQVEPAKKSEPKPVPLPAATLAKLAPKEATINVPKSIAGQKGEWQIVAPAAPADGAITDWLELIKTSSHMLLDLCANEADVMQIFKKNKVLFDTVKGHDAVFFKEMMGKFTDTKNKLIKE
jgi:hypothetical protein